MPHAIRSGLIAAVLAAGLLPGCAAQRVLDRAGGCAALYNQFAAYDGHSGRLIRFADLAGRAAGADVVFFGEHHNDPVCNALEAQLLFEVVRRGRSVALAMEFFEADSQAVLDDYLRGRIGEAEFRERARQSRRYALSHRPLIELCKSAEIPVIAANVPRRLLRDFGRSGEPYAEWRASLAETDQALVPRTSEIILGRYWQRFAAIMETHELPASQPAATPATQPTVEPQRDDAPPSLPGGIAELLGPSLNDVLAAMVRPFDALRSSDSAARPPESAVDPDERGVERDDRQAAAAAATQPQADSHSATASQPSEFDPLFRAFKSQLLWDDAMSERVASERARRPDRLVLLIVGGFHVEHDGGTAQKFRARRPRDRTFTIVYRSTADPALPFDAEDLAAGDVVVYGITSPPEDAGDAPARE